MILLIGVVEAPPDRVAALKPALIEMMASTREEPGCIDYAFAEEIGAPGVVRLVERWVDADALREHFNSPHMATFNKVLEEVPLARFELTLFEGGRELTLDEALAA